VRSKPGTGRSSWSPVAAGATRAGVVVVDADHQHRALVDDEVGGLADVVGGERSAPGDRLRREGRADRGAVLRAHDGEENPATRVLARQARRLPRSAAPSRGTSRRPSCCRRGRGGAGGARRQLVYEYRTADVVLAPVDPRERIAAGIGTRERRRILYSSAPELVDGDGLRARQVVGPFGTRTTSRSGPPGRSAGGASRPRAA